MPDPTPLLTGELLEQLAGRWRAQRAPILEHLQPGLSGDAIDELTATLGLVVPAEARVWWGWHDGVGFPLPPGHAELVGTGFAYLSLARALERTEQERELATGVAEQLGIERERVWPSHLLALSADAHGGVAAISCAHPERADAPVYYSDCEDPDFEGVQAPRTRTLGEFVTWWIEAIDSGAADYDATAGRWRYVHERLDPARAMTRLV